MQLVVRGKNFEIADRLRQFVESKVPSRLARVLPELAEVEVELSAAKTKSAENRYVAQITVKVNGALIRGEQSGPDSYAAVDSVVDKIERQVSRFKSKKYGAYNKALTRALPEEAELAASEAEEDEEEAEGQLVRTKRFPMKPMSVEEALMQMQMIGHDFFVFHNSDTDGVSVVYRRRDGNFGLIEPELV